MTLPTKRRWLAWMPALCATLVGCAALVDFADYDVSPAPPPPVVLLPDADVGEARFRIDPIAEVRVLEGRSTTFEVPIIRDPGFDGVVAVELQAPSDPAWYTAETIATEARSEDTFVAVITVVAGPDAAGRTFSAKLVARNGEVRKDVPVTVSGVGAPGTYDRSFADGGVYAHPALGSYADELVVEDGGTVLVTGGVLRQAAEGVISNPPCRNGECKTIVLRLDRAGIPLADFDGEAAFVVAGDAGGVTAIRPFPAADRSVVIGATQALDGGRGGSPMMLRLLPDGGIDPSFGGVAGPAPLTTAMNDEFSPGFDGWHFAARPDTPDRGFLAVFKYSGNYASDAGATGHPTFVQAFDGTGRPDTTFGVKTDDGSGGAISVAAGSRYATARGNPVTVRGANGDPDPGFAGTGKRPIGDGAGIDAVSAVPGCAVWLSPASLLVASRIAETGTFRLHRFGAGGSPDPTFGDGGAVDTEVPWETDECRIFPQPDGKLLLIRRTVIVRFDASGRLDTSFGLGGEGAAGFGGDRIAWADVGIDATGRIVLAGRFFPSNGNASLGRLVVARMWP